MLDELAAAAATTSEKGAEVVRLEALLKSMEEELAISRAMPRQMTTHMPTGASAHMPTCPHAHMPTCPHAHMPTCLHAYMPTCPRRISYTLHPTCLHAYVVYPTPYIRHTYILHGCPRRISYTLHPTCLRPTECTCCRRKTCVKSLSMSSRARREAACRR